MSTSGLPILPLEQVAADNSVTRDAVSRWLKRHDLKRKPYCVIQKTPFVTLYVRLDAAERYAEGRAPKRPKGKVKCKVLAAELGLNQGGHLFNRLVRGVPLEAFNRNRYMSPDDAAMVRERFLRMKPPLGTRALLILAQENGVDHYTVVRWAKANSVPTPLYYNGRRFARYLSAKDAALFTQSLLRKAA